MSAVRSELSIKLDARVDPLTRSWSSLTVQRSPLRARSSGCRWVPKGRWRLPLGPWPACRCSPWRSFCYVTITVRVVRNKRARMRVNGVGVRCFVSLLLCAANLHGAQSALGSIFRGCAGHVGVGVEWVRRGSRVRKRERCEGNKTQVLFFFFFSSMGCGE